MSDLQFDKAEGTGAAANEPKCSVCGQPIRDSYYEVNGQIVCPRCRDELERQLSAGSSAGRFGKALVFGLAASAVGTGIYFGIMYAANIELGLIAILVGYMVGTAVKKGSNGLGGWRYQALAMFLTYTSIVASYASYFIEELRMSGRSLFGSLVLIYAFPFKEGFENIIGFIIIGIALYEAWVINRPAQLAFAGPFKVGQPR